MPWSQAPSREQSTSAIPALGAGLLLRAVFLWMHPHIAGDTLIYGDLAHNLLLHGTYGLTESGHVRATLIRLPGYPLFLACCFALFGMSNFAAVVGVQVFIDLLSCWLLYRTALRIFGKRTGLFALWLAVLCPFTANYAAAPLTETPSIFCVTLALYGLVRWLQERELQSAGVIGLACCGAVLLRPDGILLAGVVIPAMLWMAWSRKRGPFSASRVPEGLGGGAPRRSWAGLLLCIGLLLICLGAWTVRNYRVYHVFQPLAPKYANDPEEAAPTGFARWYRTWAAGLGDTARVYWEYDGSELTPSDLPSWAIEGVEEQNETRRVYKDYNDEQSSTPRIEAEFAALAKQREQKHPVRSFLVMPSLRLGDMWLRPRTELLPHMPLDWWDPRRPRAAVFAAAYGLLNLALLGCACLGAWRWRRARWSEAGPVAGAMLGYVALRSFLLMTIDNSEPRYVLECYPVVLLLAAVCLSAWGASAQGLRQQVRSLKGSA